MEPIQHKNYYTDESFVNQNWAEQDLSNIEFDNCLFTTCRMDTADLHNAKFVDCIFKDCDLSLAKIGGTAFQSCTFTNCKLLGLHFDDCSTFLLGFTFVECTINLSSFYKLKLKNTKFANCKLNEVDFTETVLAGSVFANCDLQQAVFFKTDLTKADFRSSENYSIDPEANKMTSARFSLPAVVGLLDKYKIKIN